MEKDNVYKLTHVQMVAEVASRSDVVAFLQTKGFSVEAFAKYASTKLARRTVEAASEDIGSGEARLTAHLWALAKDFDVLRPRPVEAAHVGTTSGGVADDFDAEIAEAKRIYEAKVASILRRRANKMRRDELRRQDRGFGQPLKTSKAMKVPACVTKRHVEMIRVYEELHRAEEEEVNSARHAENLRAEAEAALKVAGNAAEAAAKAANSVVLNAERVTIAKAMLCEAKQQLVDAKSEDSARALVRVRRYGNDVLRATDDWLAEEEKARDLHKKAVECEEHLKVLALRLHRARDDADSAAAVAENAREQISKIETATMFQTERLPSPPAAGTPVPQDTDVSVPKPQPVMDFPSLFLPLNSTADIRRTLNQASKAEAIANYLMRVVAYDAAFPKNICKHLLTHEYRSSVHWPNDGRR